MIPRTPRSTPFPYTTLFRSRAKSKGPRAKGQSAKCKEQGAKRNQFLAVSPFALSSSLFAATAWLFAQKSPDRKSTRLNSSHRCISYAVFCLKKKKKKKKDKNILQNLKKKKIDERTESTI